VLAKGTTSRVIISGGNLPTPVEITDANVLRQFQIWAGPGTSSCVRGDCVEGTEGFFIDWLAGPVTDRPSGLKRYEVSFYVIDDRFPGQRAREQLAYVVSYEYDSAGSDGYVYLPGRSDSWFRLNSRSIYRGREGNWFHATRAWQDAVTSLLAQR
jgi:hypothetical protein